MIIVGDQIRNVLVTCFEFEKHRYKVFMLRKMSQMLPERLWTRVRAFGELREGCSELQRGVRLFCVGP